MKYSLVCLWVPQTAEKKKILEALDQVNKNFGKDMLRFAVQGYKKEYKLKSAHLSKRYTTDINEVLEIGSEVNRQ